MKKGPRKYGILESDMNDIISVFRANPGTEKVILFGSRAKGKYDPGSDIDICWVGESLLLADVSRASLAYDDLFLPYKLDIVLLHTIKDPALLEHIERVGISLYQV